MPARPTRPFIESPPASLTVRCAAERLLTVGLSSGCPVGTKVTHTRRSQGESVDRRPRVSLPVMAKQIAPFLMFQGGVAEQAMDFYTSLFDDGRIVDITRYGPEGPGPAGTVQTARFVVAGQEFFCSDSFVTHGFTFTPSFSVWVETESRDELERLFTALRDGGADLMPLAEYGFSRRFGWVNDRYGVSWQLNFS